MSDRTLRLFVGALAAAGLLVAGYLTYARYSDTTITCSSGGCETVQKSSYATVAGIPVAVLGLVGYAAILATAFVVGDVARAAGAALALGGFAFSMFLLYAQLVPIDAVCDWCVANDVIVTLLVPFTVLRLRR
ncbi:MAG TPA: vitamin K epoxide reductase family protein [Gaiellaceae bacterium]|nr:vitamin K epoxide reductase family protein [Gaiellaceae bacterium]